MNEKGYLAVKRRSGHFSYSVDPRGVLGAMTRAMLFNHESGDKLTSTSQSLTQSPLFLSRQQVCTLQLRLCLFLHLESFFV